MQERFIIWLHTPRLSISVQISDPISLRLDRPHVISSKDSNAQKEVWIKWIKSPQFILKAFSELAGVSLSPGQKLKVNGFSGNQQGSSFGLYRSSPLLWFDLIALHQSTESKVHLQLSHPLPHAGPHSNTEWDCAIGVMLRASRARPQPALWNEPFWVGKLIFIVTDSVVAEMKLRLFREPIVIDDYFSILTQAAVTRNNRIHSESFFDDSLQVRHSGQVLCGGFTIGTHRHNLIIESLLYLWIARQVVQSPRKCVRGLMSTAKE